MNPFLYFLFLFLSIPALSQHFNPTLLEQIIQAEQKAHRSLQEPPSATRYTDDYNLVYQRLELHLDPAVHYVEGVITSYFIPLVEGFQIVHFDVSDLLSVNGVLHHGLPLEFSQSNNELIIVLPTAIQTGAVNLVAIVYEGAPPTSGFGSFITDVHNETNPTPILWTLSEPYGARDWWVCKQGLKDKIDLLDVIVTTPNAYRVASNGLLVNEVFTDTLNTFHWRHRYPIATYLVAVAVTDYAVYNEEVILSDGSQLPVLNYVYPESLESAQADIPIIGDMIWLYDSLTVTYPFANEKYGHAQFGWGGGMEHQTMSFMANFNFELMAHELAHQWFGDCVTTGSWADIWLNEGFATYFTGLCYEHLAPDYWMAYKNVLLGNATAQPDGSVFCTDTTNIPRLFSGRLTYRKAAYLLHMLRFRMGDEHFFTAIRNYITDPELAYSFARTADLKAHFEMQSGQDLTDFFNQWFYGEGYPSYHLYWQQTDGDFVLTINQTQSHPSVSFFQMPVEVQLWYGGGQDTTLRFDHLFSGQIFSTSLPFAVDSVHFDPEKWILSNQNTVTNGAVGIEVTTSSPTVEVRLFPNPTNETVHIQLNGLSATQPLVRVEVLDSQGKSWGVYSAMHNALTINTQSWPTGLYVCLVQTNHGSWVKRLMIR